MDNEYHWPCYCTSTVLVYSIIHFCNSIGLFEWKWICACFYCLLIYVFPLDIQLSRRGVDNPVNALTPQFLSQARTWLCNVICDCPYFMLSELRWEVIAWFIDIVGIDDHHCLNFPFIFSHFTLAVIIIRNFVATHDHIYTIYPSINMLQYFDRFLLQMTIFKHNSARIQNI